MLWFYNIAFQDIRMDIYRGLCLYQSVLAICSAVVVNAVCGLCHRKEDESRFFLKADSLYLYQASYITFRLCGWVHGYITDTEK